MNEKKVAVIGGGVSGLAAGVYLADNGYDVTVYEKHFVSGGQCTGWTREKLPIDGCIHFLVGTSPDGPLYPLWKHIGAFGENTKIYRGEYFNRFSFGGETVAFYGDTDKLREELMRVSPADKRLIDGFIRAIKAYRKIDPPLDRPVDSMNPLSLVKYGLKMAKVVPYLLKYRKISMDEYAAKFSSPILKEAFGHVMPGGYNVHSLLYVMQAFSKGDCGAPEGGSATFAANIEKHLLSVGGKVKKNSEVTEIRVENGRATGITVNGEFVRADYIVAACDAHHALVDLLGGKYAPKFFSRKFSSPGDYPPNLACYLSFRVSERVKDKIPKMQCFGTEKYRIGEATFDSLTVRNYSYDESLYPGDGVMTSIIVVPESVYDYFKSLDRAAYLAEKKKLGLFAAGEIRKFFGLGEEDVSLIDVATPLTYERYCNAYKGSYQSFIATKRGKGLMAKGTLKGLGNVFLCGQWIMDPGGLPIALFSAKYAAFRVAKADGKKFVDKD